MSAAVRPLHLVSAVELERAGDFPARSLETLKRSGLVPEPALKAVRGGRPGWASDAIAFAAMTGALVDVGCSLLLAAKLTGPFLASWSEGSGGHLPGMLRPFLFEALKAGADRASVDGDEDYIGIRDLLSRYPEIYSPGQSTKFDIRVIVVNRTYIFSRDLSGLNSFAGFRNPARPEVLDAIIFNWKRGMNSDDVEVRPFLETLNQDECPGRPNEAAGAAKEREAFDALDRAVSRLEVNVSLAIRNGLDRIHDHRAQRGAPDGLQLHLPVSKDHP